MDPENSHKNKVHKILAHSYLFYFISFLVSLSFDYVFPLKFFEGDDAISTGIIFFVIGTFLIVWAQKTSHKMKKDNITKDTFSRGPYKFMRTPTHFGLFLLMFGFGIVANAMFVVVFSIASFIITRLVFIRKEERILQLKYGHAYREYKKAVKF